MGEDDNQTVFSGAIPGMGGDIKVRQKALPWIVILVALVIGGGSGGFLTSLMEGPDTQDLKARIVELEEQVEECKAEKVGLTDTMIEVTRTLVRAGTASAHGA